MHQPKPQVTTPSLPESESRDTTPRWREARALVALIARDMAALRRSPGGFLVRTVLQPLLLVFALGYVLPKIGQTPAQRDTTATTLLAGLLAIVVLFQGMFAVALPLVTELGQTREIEDRVLSPIPTPLIALAKVLAGAVQGLLAAIVVFPLAEYVPAARPSLHPDWPVLLTFAPLAALCMASLGLLLGTLFDPRAVTSLFAVLLTPMMYLGCTLYPWSGLEPVRWLQVVSLANPVTYVSEGFRAAVTPTHHLSLWAVYPVTLTLTSLMVWLGVSAFHRRVVT